MIRGNSTHPCESPTPTVNNCDFTPVVNGCDFTLTRTQSRNAATWRPVISGRQHRTLASGNTPQSLLQGTWVVCSHEVDKKYSALMDILPRFLENFLEKKNLVTVATARTRAYEREAQKVQPTRARYERGPGRMEKRTFSFSVIKPKVDVRFLQLQRRFL